MWSAYSLSHQFQTTALLNTSDLLTLVTNHYSYAGGAHGNYYNVLHTFATDSLQLITFNDVFLTDKEAELAALLTQKVKTLDIGTFEENIPVTKNIAFTQDGLLFDYPPYEIAPYAAGEIELVLPYAEISHLMTGWGETLALGVMR